MSAVDPGGVRRRLRALGELIPTLRATPFTFCYGLVLLATALYAELADEATVNRLLRGSSTDAAHLADRPALVMVASALWIAGGLFSFYGLAFAPVLGALERRVGGLRTAVVFTLGHVLATLATELPVAGAVAAGRLPAASLHRLDYGISFGLMACLGALAGLLAPAWKWTILGGAGLLCAQDLIEFADPLASWGHPIALLIGIACQVRLRDRVRPGYGAAPARGTAGDPPRVPEGLLPVPDGPLTIARAAEAPRESGLLHGPRPARTEPAPAPDAAPGGEPRHADALGPR
ncbi:rhomboid-like protein [Streptomyces orinoci]|uniref:Rhomboid-like protein n=1 Tax=Streptomyces orinoci TaxID=67339 RepID=A0ABV3JT43_STRON